MISQKKEHPSTSSGAGAKNKDFYGVVSLMKGLGNRSRGMINFYISPTTDQRRP